ncbi:hypothetical protein D3C71_1092210 [compost metagenome]
MLQSNHFENNYAYKIYEILEAYGIAYYLSKNKKLSIYVLFSEDAYKLSVERKLDVNHDETLFTIKYYPNMKKNNIEVYYIQHDAAVRINEAGDLADFITINRQRAKLSRFAIEDGVIFMDGLERLQQFIAAVDKYL